MHGKMKFKVVLVLTMLCVSIIPLWLLSLSYSMIVNPSVTSLSHEYLQNTLTLTVNAFDNYFDERIRFIHSLRDATDFSELLNYFSNGEPDSSLVSLCEQHLVALGNTSPYILSLYICDKNSNVLASNVKNGNMLICAEAFDSLFPTGTISEDPVISGVSKYPDENGTPFFSIVTQCVNDGVSNGYLVANYTCDIFKEVYSTLHLFTSGHLSFYDKNGGQIFSHFPSLSSLSDPDNIPLAQFAKQFYQIDFLANPEGFLTYSIGEDVLKAYYKVCSPSGWIVFASISDLDGINYKKLIILLTCSLLFFSILVSILSTFLILHRVMKLSKNVSDILVQIRNGDYSCRIDSNENELVCNAFVHFNNLMDSVEARQEELEKRTYDLAQSNERYQIITDYTREIIFEINFDTDEADYSFTWWKKFGYDPVMKNVHHDLRLGENVHPDDMGVFTSWIEKIWRGSQNTKEEFRIRTIDNDYFWCRVRTVPIFGKDSKPVKLVGLIQDIDDSKKKEDELIQRADYDLLSQLFNRLAFESRVTQLIMKKHRFALMYIDIDDFRRYNTKYGHEFGDRVIQFIGSKINKAIGKSGFAGRVGGDEFIICISSPSMLPFVDAAAEQVGEELKSGLRVRESDVPVEVQCSIGIVFYPDHAESYEELSARADKAMYTVKHSGKNSYAIASDSDLEVPVSRAIQTAPTEE